MSKRQHENGARGRSNKLYIFTKPAIPGRVKTRLVGELSAQQTALLHEAFLLDVCRAVGQGNFELTLAWALEVDEAVPEGVGADRIPGLRQQGEGLGERLYLALAQGAEDGSHVAALGSDHPEVSEQTLNDAFNRLEAGANGSDRPEEPADVVLGPTPDGGYFLIAMRASSVSSRIFQDISWSTSEVLEQTLDRCRELDLRVELLPMGHDVDVAEDLEGLIARLSSKEGGCPATREILTAWGRLAPAGVNS